MGRVFISDKTLKQSGKQMPLSFREKIELSRLIDRLEVDALELPAIENQKVDPLLIKSISAAVKHAVVAVPVQLNADSVQLTWNALKEAPGARLQVSVPVSSVQMEYLFHLKPAALSARVVETIAECRKYTDQVELIAEDAFRGDRDFLVPLVQQAIAAGASHVTFQEAAGVSLPEELRKELAEILADIGAAEQVIFGIDCSNELSLADACAVESVRCGIREVKAAAFALNCASLAHVVRVLALKGEKMDVNCQIRREEIRRVTGQIEALCRANLPAQRSFAADVQDQEGELRLSFHDSKESVLRSMEQLGYLLSTEDQEKVYQAFLNVAEKKGSISLKELDALVATEAMQVPPTYQVISYVFNSGNDIGAMAHMKLKYHDQTLDGISAGDGVIDAAFLALEKAIGRHFELDEFQIQAITEGREAMGETVVRLRSEGKLYSGRGLSTDIVGASIMAYVNALNKIVYEEEEE
ncbi:MAG: hypothetical protein IJ153_09155 [Clostridia bacterium]|nr:hypothetical protein [Clostridia bacterium]